MSKELGVSYNVSKLEPKLKSHQFPGFLNGLPTYGSWDLPHLFVSVGSTAISCPRMRRRRSSKADSNEALARLSREPLFTDPYFPQATEASQPDTPPEVQHGETTANPTSLRLAILVATILENAGTVLLNRIVSASPSAHTSDAPASPDTQPFIPTTAVFLGELLKLIICGALVLMGVGGDFKGPTSDYDYTIVNDSDKSAAARVQRGLSGLAQSFQPAEMASTALPALIYVVQDQLVYFSLAHCTAGLFIATYQLKVVFGGALASFVLGRTLPRGKQVAVLLLYGGISLVHYAAYIQRNSQKETTEASTESVILEQVEQQFQTRGIAAAVAAALCSSVAGTYSEALLKGKTTTAAAEPYSSPPKPLPSLWLTNLRLSTWGTAVGFAAVWLQDRRTIWGTPLSQGGGFLRGYTPGVWLLVCAQSAGGLVLSACLRYHSNVSKNFAQGISSLAIFLVSCTALSEPSSPLFVVGAALVVFANVLYRI